MQILLFGLMLIIAAFVWLDKRIPAIYCFALTMLVAIGELISRATTNLHLPL